MMVYVCAVRVDDDDDNDDDVRCDDVLGMRYVVICAVRRWVMYVGYVSMDGMGAGSTMVPVWVYVRWVSVRVS